MTRTYPTYEQSCCKNCGEGGHCYSTTEHPPESTYECLNCGIEWTVVCGYMAQEQEDE